MGRNGPRHITLQKLWPLLLQFLATPVNWSAEVIKRAIVKCAGILDYSELRLKQAVVVQEFVSGKDVFVSPPTASGKSL